MTRLCMVCKRIMGEKCARCGTEATPIKTNPNGQAMTGTEFNCHSCGHHFVQGDGGETGAICEPCFDGLLRKAHEQKKEAI